MSLTWHEHPDSRPVEKSEGDKDGSTTYAHIITGTSSDLTAFGYAQSKLPATDPHGFVLTNIRVHNLTVGGTEAEWSWRVESTYNHPNSEDSKDSKKELILDWTWSTGTQTGHIDHAISQVEYPGGLLDDAGALKRAINVSVDNEVRGIDIPVPQMELIIWKYYPLDYTTGISGVQFAKFLAAMCGKTNDAPWWGFDRGELRFDGAKPEARGVFDEKITFTFACEANRANIDFGLVGDFNVNVPLKRGHHYLHVHHRRDEDDAGKEIIVRPWRVCVAQVLEEADFSMFGLGNSPP